MHDVIMPLKTTSDRISADQMNLWIIDESLVFHDFLASDLNLASMRESPPGFVE